MGVLDMIRGRKDHHIAEAVITESEAGKDEPNAPNQSGSDSDTLSLEERDARENEKHPNEVTPTAELGVQKAEAAALVWTKKAVYGTYAW